MVFGKLIYIMIKKMIQAIKKHGSISQSLEKELQEVKRKWPPPPEGPQEPINYNPKPPEGPQEPINYNPKPPEGYQGPDGKFVSFSAKK